MPGILHFEDFAIGQTFELGSATMSKQEIIEFATEFDAQPFHLDETAGKESLLGGLAASGWHTCGIAMRLLATNLLNKSSCQGSPGIKSLKWVQPVYPNDKISAVAEVVETKALRSKPEFGMVTIRLKATKQDDTTVLIWENPILFKKRETN